MIDLTRLESLLACPACIDNDSAAAVGANMAIMFMLVVLTFVLGAFIALIVRFARGEKRLNSAGDQS